MLSHCKPDASETATPDYHSRPDNKAMKASSDRNVNKNICVMTTFYCHNGLYKMNNQQL